MKRYLILGAALAVVTVLLFIWAGRGGSTRAPGTPEVTTSHAVAPTDAGSHEDAVSLGSSAQPPKDGAPPAIPDSEIERYRRETADVERRYNQDNNAPIAFYGLVVDQDTNALQNVAVQLDVAEHYHGPFSQ